MKTTFFLANTVLLLSLNLSRGEGPYHYPLQPGTSAWNNATPAQRVSAATISNSWLETATSHQLFLSAVQNPYFRSILFGSQTITKAYTASRTGAPLSVLAYADSAPQFGSETVAYLRGLNLTSIRQAACSQWNGPCWMDYIIVCHMAGLPSAISTMDVPTIQTLFRLAVWDSDYLNSQGDTDLASAAARLMYVIYNLPASVRGNLPPGVSLPALTADQQFQVDHRALPAELVPYISSAKTALGLTSRP